MIKIKHKVYSQQLPMNEKKIYRLKDLIELNQNFEQYISRNDTSE